MRNINDIGTNITVEKDRHIYSTIMVNVLSIKITHTNCGEL